MLLFQCGWCKGGRCGSEGNAESQGASELRRYLRMSVRKAGEEGSQAARLCTAGRRADTQLGEPTMLPAIYLRHLAKSCPSLAGRHT